MLPFIARRDGTTSQETHSTHPDQENSHYKMLNSKTIVQKKVVKPDPMCISGIGFHIHAPSTKEDIFREFVF